MPDLISSTWTGTDAGKDFTQQQSDRNVVGRAAAFFVQHVRPAEEDFAADFTSTWQQACFVARSSVQQHGKNFAATGLTVTPIRHNTTAMDLSVVIARSL